MRLSLYTVSRTPSPRTEALVHSLEQAGHDVSASRIQARRLGRDRLVGFPSHGPYTGHGTAFGPGTEPEVLFAATSRVIGEADRAAGMIDGWVARRPDWPRAGRDLAWEVPARPELSVPVGGPVPEDRPWDAHRGSPQPGRHSGRTVTLCFRSTPGSPAHHLRAALERAGIVVSVAERLSGDRDVDAVVVVESPDPPLETDLPSPTTPVVYWVHHGEHHLPGNLRLASRYQADLVLLAHSWHLALRFDRPVHRFPFAVAPEAAGSGRPFDERSFDAAFVGTVEGGAYARRRRLLADLEQRTESTAIRSGIPPAEMAALYADSRMVLNEGGTRHQPVTMRVFEAIGAGALLLSEPAPGLDLLFGDRYLPLGEEIGVLPDRTAAAEMAEAARREALTAHTYDHRVDLLMRYLDGLAVGERRQHRETSRESLQGLDRLLDRHPHGQRILDLAGIVDAPDREVWSIDDLTGEPAPGSFDTVVVGARVEPWMTAAARRFVVGRTLDPAAVKGAVRDVERIDDLTVVALDSPGYHVDTVGGVPGD